MEWWTIFANSSTINPQFAPCAVTLLLGPALEEESAVQSRIGEDKKVLFHYHCLPLPLPSINRHYHLGLTFDPEDFLLTIYTASSYLLAWISYDPLYT